MSELVGKRIQWFRREKGLTQEQLAHAVGLSLSAIRSLEQGRMPPSFNTLLSVAHVFRVDPFYLLISPDVNPVHALVELTRGAPKAVVMAMKAACEGLRNLPLGETRNRRAL